MNASQRHVSLGAVALLLCLALPSGLLSLLAESTTGEQVDRADLVIAGRVASLQDIADPEVTAVEFAVSDVLWGSTHAAHLTVSVDGRPPLQVGDTVVALVSRHPASLLGALQLRKNPRNLAWEIVSPVSGMLAQGLGSGGPDDPIPLALFQEAIRLRKGLAPRAGGAGTGSSAADTEGSIDPDAYEPNNTLATATHLTGLHPPSLLTGNPLLVTGLTLVPSSDVDFFSFDSPPLTILHAETKAVTGLLAPDTLMGLFNTPAGDLLASDDDDGEGSMSRLDTPLEAGGTYAVAIESAPDSNLDFLGDDGTTTGFYDLALELELGSYLWNQLDLIFGVSPDGTFIEDFIGFKEIGGQDVFLVDVPADGWATDFDADFGPAGVTHVYGGGGDQLTDPAFVNPLLPIAFELGSYQDFAGFNRRGHAHAISLVNYNAAGEHQRGLVVDFDYHISVGDNTVVGQIDLYPLTNAQITNLFFARVSDVNLFGQGADQFFWSFNPQSPFKAFAVDGLTNVGNVVAPAQPFGNATGDLQTAVTIDAGSLQAPQVFSARTGATYIKGSPTATAALNEAVRRLRLIGIDTWVVAVDADPATGLFSAFGTGLGAP
jgi:hypothetical protein